MDESTQTAQTVATFGRFIGGTWCVHATGAGTPVRKIFYTHAGTQWLRVAVSCGQSKTREQHKVSVMSNAVATAAPDPTPPRRHKRSPITPEREDAFIAALIQSGGSFAFASLASAPKDGNDRTGENNYGPCYETWRSYIKRSPAFAQRVQDALTKVLGDMESLLHQRAHEKDRRPIVDRTGAIVAYAEDARNSNSMLLAWLRKHSTEWLERKIVALNAEVKHTTDDDSGGLSYRIRVEDLQLMSEPDRVALGELLSKLEAAKAAEKKRLGKADDDAAKVPAFPPPAPSPEM